MEGSYWLLNRCRGWIAVWPWRGWTPAFSHRQPPAKGYADFHFHDCAKLTIIGVVMACLAWPVVTRISSAPRWLSFRLAVLVTLVLWLPDLYLLDLGQPGRAVAVLIVTHLAIALVTCGRLVHIAKVTPAPARHRHPAPEADYYAGRQL